jgi:hypothetical protein
LMTPDEARAAEPLREIQRREDLLDPLTRHKIDAYSDDIRRLIGLCLRALAGALAYKLGRWEVRPMRGYRP